ncbi:unnamed protein product, partial [Eruca vesicaria subsp. sativa]|nr:unnamed protein product [Eruca vesicaria subsp. sativa]
MSFHLFLQVHVLELNLLFQRPIAIRMWRILAWSIPFNLMPLWIKTVLVRVEQKALTLHPPRFSTSNSEMSKF